MNLPVKRSSGLKTNFSDFVFNMAANVILICILLLVLYPLYFILTASVSDPYAVSTGQTLLLPKGIGFDGYIHVFQDNRILSGYANTIFYTSGGTVFGLTATLLAGYALSRKDLAIRNICMKFFVFTMFFSGGLIPTYMVVKGLHLTDTPYVMMILGSLSVFNIIIARTFFQSTIPTELLEAAYIDGCSDGYFFLAIVLPLSKAIIAVIALYIAVWHWNSFFNGLIYLCKSELYPLQLILRDILMLNQLQSTDNTDPAAAAQLAKIAETMKYDIIVVSSLPVLLCYPFVQKYFVKGMMIGSIKG